MKHTVTGIQTETTKRAFDQVWAKKGWIEVEEDGEVTGLAPESNAFDALSDRDLKKLARELGIEVGRMRREDILDQIRGQEATGEIEVEIVEETVVEVIVEPEIQAQEIQRELVENGIVRLDGSDESEKDSDSQSPTST